MPRPFGRPLDWTPESRRLAAGQHVPTPTPADKTRQRPKVRRRERKSKAEPPQRTLFDDLEET